MAIEGRANTSEQKREVIELLYRLWLHRPTLRFGQLLLNCFREDFYGIEDFQLIERLNAFYGEMESRNVIMERKVLTGIPEILEDTPLPFDPDDYPVV